MILTITCVPVLATVFLVISTTEPDLAGLTPRSQPSDKYLTLDWSALEQDHPHSGNSGPGKFDGAAVHALGYMVEGNAPIKTDERVTDFVLLPEAGNALHAAHRFGNQMVAVHLENGNRIRFSPRSLVSARGTFRTSPEDPAGSQPLYHLDHAQAQPAARNDIRRYFR
jgi:hypothetical protein